LRHFKLLFEDLQLGWGPELKEQCLAPFQIPSLRY